MSEIIITFVVILLRLSHMINENKDMSKTNLPYQKVQQQHKICESFKVLIKTL